MSSSTEKRASERFKTGAPIKYAYTTAKDLFNAKIVNCSEDGIYLESNFALQPGMVIFVADNNDNKYFRAEVKWCKKLVDSKDSNHFGIGAKYSDPALLN
jgi:hypothetical protein